MTLPTEVISDELRTLVKISDSLEIAGVRVRNRFVMPPIVTNFASEKGEVTDHILRHYEQRSKSGVGLIIVGASAVDWAHRIQKYELGIYDDRLIPSLTELAERIKAHGARAFIQLVHGGPKSYKTKVGPSQIAVKGGPVRQLSKQEIEQIKYQFIQAIARAQQAGFDGIEFHAAHFYLLSAFLSGYTNRREDEYGGTTQQKAKILVDIIKETQQEFGSFPILCRFNALENITQGIDFEEGKQIARILEAAGVAGLHVSGIMDLKERGYDNPNELACFSQDDKPVFLRGYPYQCFIPFAAIIRKVVDIPVIGVGMVRSAEFAEQSIQRELCDLVAIGRGLLADSQFVGKALNGRGAEITQCTGCNLCHKRYGASKPIVCPENKDL